MTESGDPFETSFKTKEPVVLAMYAYVSKMMIDISLALVKDNEAKKYTELHSKICNYFDLKYIKEDGSMEYPLQGLYVFALAMNLVS
ncbi:MAG: hypothetical protein GX675_02805 [Erysipelotrichaceae bacterium]|nr:hypothetical protein [Erysipelotrichaceae bacterium]